MAGEEAQVVRLKDDFYRDGFYKVLLSLGTSIIAILFLIAISIYLFLTKPLPIYFSTDNEWRILPDVPLNQPYLNEPDLIQWVSEVIPALFNYDFISYPKQLKSMEQYFTPNGLSKFLTQVNVYANADTVQKIKQFINAQATGAPVIINQGLFEGKYAWWIKMPIIITYTSTEKNYSQDLNIQILVTRISTLNNLNGVAIENFITNK